MNNRPIFCLRPEPDCQLDVSALKADGIEAFCLPMIDIKHDIKALMSLLSDEELTAYAGIIITSKQASLCLAASISPHPFILDMPVWCVGEGSAEPLIGAGFTQIHTGNEGALELAQMIMTTHQEGASHQEGVSPQEEDGQKRTYLWFSGRDIYIDLAVILATKGLVVRRHIVYEGRAANPDSTALAAYLSSDISCAMLAMSARTIDIFADWLEHHKLICHSDLLNVIVPSQTLVFQVEKRGLKGVSAQSSIKGEIIACAKKWALAT